MKNWSPFPMTSKESFIKGKCVAASRRKKKSMSNVWKFFDRSGKTNFSHSFLLIMAYLIIEVAAFSQQNLGRRGKLFVYLLGLHVYNINNWCSQLVILSNILESTFA